MLNVAQRVSIPLPNGYSFVLGMKLNDQEVKLKRMYHASLAQDRRPQSGPWPEITKRNLAFHLYPHREHKGWIGHLRRIAESGTKFNGKKVFGIALDEDTIPAEEVLMHLPLGSSPFFVLNDPRYREMTTFGRMLRELQSDDPHEATFFAHNKGITHPGNVNIASWNEMMYATCLDFPNAVNEVLRDYPVAGTFNKVGAGFKPGSWSDWHYSGSFLWFRHVPLFKQGWQNGDCDWYGVESWPSIVYRPENAGTIFLKGPIPLLDVYQDDCLAQRVFPAYIQWLRDQKPRVLSE